ncbi:hypothetical protein AB0B66_07750 [Catellatospora sp. NPDC049111]|uniref:hypothetical protein n=1 Tax=Catellatospora sp. NPDC049111 TaxID=3155271 RepID=UPI0033E951B8
MITIRTFLRSEDGTFLPVEEQVQPLSDSDYIEGAIEMNINGTEIIGRSEWDYVDQLWSYLASMVHSLRSEERAETHFPDQPVLLEFERLGRDLRISCRSGDVVRQARTSESELLDTLASAGRSFFANMSRLVPANAGSYRLAESMLRR